MDTLNVIIHDCPIHFIGYNLSKDFNVGFKVIASLMGGSIIYYIG